MRAGGGDLCESVTAMMRIPALPLPETYHCTISLIDHLHDDRNKRRATPAELQITAKVRNINRGQRQSQHQEPHQYPRIFDCLTSRLTSFLTLSSRRRNEFGLSALRADFSFPCRVTGPVDASHGRHVLINAACFAFRSGVHPFAIMRFQ